MARRCYRMALGRGKMTPMERSPTSSTRQIGRPALIVATTLCVAFPTATEAADPPRLAEADALWRARARGQAGGEPDPAPIRRALEAYESLLARRPDDLEIRWKLLRARHFYGEYVLEDGDEKLELYERTRDLADESRAMLLERHDLEQADAEVVARAFAGDSRAAAIYYYSAVHWGQWGDATGRLKAARAGVGEKLRDFGRMVVAIDERFDEAAGHRLLGRLHTEAPWIPFVTGWVDHDVAVEELERACELAPQNPFNQVYLADALLRFRQARHDEAIRRLENVVASAPRDDQLIEDLEAIAEARRLLEANRR